MCPSSNARLRQLESENARLRKLLDGVTSDNSQMRRALGLPRAGTLAATIDAEKTGALIRGSQVAMAFEALGDRWSFLVLRDIFLGSRRFEDLVRSTGASRATLAERLRSLVKEGVLRRQPYQTRPPRYEYHLTKKGADLYPTALMYWLWEKNWGGIPSLPSRLVHERCGETTTPVLSCRHCRERIDIRSVRAEIAAKPTLRHMSLPKQRRLRAADNYRRSTRSKSLHIIDVIGDRWTALIQAAAYFGLVRYADIQAALAIPTTTLADRLNLLVENGVFSRDPYQSRPVRHDYRLTEKGRALYDSAFTLHEWANRWLVRGRPAALALFHRHCDKPAEGVLRCSHCSEELKMGEVQLTADRSSRKSP